MAPIVLAGAALAGLLIMPVAFAPPALAQPMGMPDPRAMSGKPLPDAGLPLGTVTVRVARKALGNPVVDAEVTAIVTGPGGESRKRTARTDAAGRATFEGLPAGHQFRGEVSVEGERLATESFEVPAAGGVRVMLIAALGTGGGPPGTSEHGADQMDEPFSMGAMAGSARPEPSLPSGTVEVVALDESGRPLAGKEILLGQVGGGEGGDGKIHVKKAVTGADGRARFDGLGRGGGAAAVMQHNGLRLGSDAFGLPDQSGVVVELRALERTTDPSVITIGEGARIIAQLREDGVGFVEMLPLENRSNKIFDRSPGALEIPLPSDFFGAEAAEGSHKVEVRKGVGVAVFGAIPPRSPLRATGREAPDEVRFGFVLPQTGSSRSFEQVMPNGIAEFTFAVEQTEGLTVESEQISGRQDREANGKKYWLMRGAPIPPGGTLRFTLRGLPAADTTGRNVAGVLALALVVAGAILSRRTGAARGGSRNTEKDKLIERREKLFGELVALETKRRRVDGAAAADAGGPGAAAPKLGEPGEPGSERDRAERAELVRRLENVYRDLAALDARAS